jgi:hypothetical protein
MIDSCAADKDLSFLKNNEPILKHARPSKGSKMFHHTNFTR